MCDDYNDYPSQELSSGWHRSRKEHRCYACHETIRRGDRYHATTQIQDGDFGNFKHCARCRAICEALWAAGAGSIQWDLDCGEEWEENFGALPDNIAALAFLTPDEAQSK